MSPLLFGASGLIVGSFLNVIIFRYGQRGIAGRSACRHCRRQLRWFDMVPVVSWIILRGRCRSCSARISIQYPLVEAATGILFALIGGAALPLPAIPLALAIAALLVCILVYDLQHTIIPDVWVWPFAVLALASAIFNFQPAPLTACCSLGFSIFNLLSGPAAALPPFSLWALSRGRWMGFGDVKLSVGIGWLLGFPFGLIAVFFAFILGAAVSVPLLIWGKLLSGKAAGLTMKSEVPFGPFLITSCLIIWFMLLYNIPLPFTV